MSYKHEPVRVENLRTFSPQNDALVLRPSLPTRCTPITPTSRAKMPAQFEKNVAGKTYVITGSSTGIGRSVGERRETRYFVSLSADGLSAVSCRLHCLPWP